MFNNQLIQMGLSENQAPVYNLLLEQGSLSTAAMAKQLDLSRPLIYKTLDELEAMELVVKNKKEGSSATFAVSHPEVLRQWVENKTQEAQQSQHTMESVFADMVSQYNLEQGRPTIRTVEGFKGIEEILYDSLSSSETIYTYVDTNSIEQYVGVINSKYVKERKKKRVHKKILMIDCDLAREKAKATGPYTEIRLISAEEAPEFQAAMEIYDGKISYITFGNNLLTSSLIYDQEVYKLHRFTFEALWKYAKQVNSEV